VYHEARNAAGEAGRDALDQLAARLLQQIGGSAEVDSGQQVVGGNKAQHALQLIWVLRVHLCRHTRLPKAAGGEL
jgi:hypothetical protein